MQSLNIDFLKNASAAGPGAVFQNELYNLLIAQIEGSFVGLSLVLEGRTEVGTGPWETISGWSMSDMDARLPSVTDVGIYEYGIENVRELRFRVLALVSGSVSAVGVLYDSASGMTYPYNAAPTSIQFGDPNLFVKGVAEQIFFDPTTGNIVGYDKTATEGSVSITANLAEISGGMGNQLIGVLPDTARVSGTYSSAAFSLDTRKRIMGGEIAYDATAQVCETITADSAVLKVSRDPVPFFAEQIPKIDVITEPEIAEISNTPVAVFANGAENEPLYDLTIKITPAQAGSGKPSPNNIRPLSGWTGAKIFVSPTLKTEDGVTYPVSWAAEAGTVYGGTLDVISGTLTVTMVSKTYNSASSWSEFSAGLGGYMRTVDNILVTANTGICDQLPTVNFLQLPGIMFGNGYIYISDANRWFGVSNITEFGAYLAEHPLTIVYYVDNPQTYQLSPTQITTFLLENRIWANTGNIELLRYQTNWYIAEKIPTDCRCYIKENGDQSGRGTAYHIDSETKEIVDFTAVPGKSYEVIYFSHVVSAQMLPVPTIWNPVMMTVQERYGVYAKQGASAERGILRGWLTFIVPRAILNANAGVNASQTSNADTSGNWIALPEKPENMPMCACNEDAHPLAYYVYVPCSGVNDAVSSVVSVGSGLTLKAGRTAQLPIKLVMPDDSLVQPDFATLGYYSENDAVAVVDNTGAVTAVSEGETVIWAVVYKSDGSQLSCGTVVVVEGIHNMLTANRNNIIVN